MRDLPGLGLRVLASGGRTWIVRYRVGKQHGWWRLARRGALSPPEARRLAKPILNKAKVGKDTRIESDRSAGAGVRHVHEAGRELH